MLFTCSHCGTALAAQARSCDRCGAPVQASMGAGEVPAGFVAFSDPWRGFRTARPEGWRVLYPHDQAVCFEHPDRLAWLELITLPPNPVVDAEQQARVFLSRLPQVELRLGGQPTPTQAAVAFRSPEVEGTLMVRLSPSGCVAVYARRLPGADVDLEGLIRPLLATLGPIPPIPREPWVCPHEQSFRLVIPSGWRVDSTIHLHAGTRTPWFRAFGDPSGRVLVVREPELAFFVDMPDAPPAAPQEKGLFATLGRWAQQAGHAVASLGGTPMPFTGLRPVAERHFFPKVAAALPGTELLGFEDFGNPARADMRVAYPDGNIAVFRLEGQRMPDPMAPQRWIAALSHWYSAPRAVFEDYEPLLRRVAESFTQNPQWTAAENQRVQSELAMQRQMSQMRHQSNMNILNSQMRAAQVQHQANNDVLDIQMQGWHDQQAAVDAGHHATVQGIREVTEYAAPAGFTGPSTIEASSSFDQVWSDGAGNLFGGDWSLDVPADWEALKPR